MQDNNGEIQLKDILTKLSEYKIELWNKKGKILFISFLFFVLGILISFLFTTKYKSELTFVVEDAKGANPLISMSGIASQLGFDFGGKSSATFSKQNIMELLKSRGVVEATLLRRGKIDGKSDLLVEHYIKINDFQKYWVKNKEFDGVNFNKRFTLQHDSVMSIIWNEIIESKINIEIQNKEANIITLSFTSTNENFAKQFTEVLIDEMSKMYITYQTKQANNTLDFLQDRADSVFAQLEQSELEFAKIKDFNQRIIKASGRLKELQLMRDVEVLNTMYLELIKNLEISKMTLLNQTPIIQIIDRPILPLETNELSKSLFGILGGFLGIFLSIFYFIFSKLFHDALSVS